MRKLLRPGLAGLFVASCLAVLVLAYTSPVAQRTFTPRALGDGLHLACSTTVTMPLVGPSYSKPDSWIFQTFVWSSGAHANPACSIFTKGSYGSPWNVGEWGAWTFQFIADSGVEFNEIGRPAASFDYVQVKAKPFGPDSLVFSMTSKFIGNITTNLLVPAPELARLPVVNHETLSVAGDIFEFLAAGATDTLWLPLAWRRLKPIYILSSNNACVQTTIVCQATDSLSGVAGNHCHPAARGKLITLSSNAAHGWYSYP